MPQAFVARGSSLKVGHFGGHLDVLREEFNIKVQENDILRGERDELRVKGTYRPRILSCKGVHSLSL
jgi:hypothetical protein